MSNDTAPISAMLNCDALWNGYESPNEYPTSCKKEYFDKTSHGSLIAQLLTLSKSFDLPMD